MLLGSYQIFQKTNKVYKLTYYDLDTRSGEVPTYMRSFYKRSEQMSYRPGAIYGLFVSKMAETMHISLDLEEPRQTQPG